MNQVDSVLVFGASGAIGRVVADWFMARRRSVVCVSRSGTAIDGVSKKLVYDPFADDTSADIFDADGPYDAVVWAQGSNMGDNVYNIDEKAHLDLYRANCVYILMSLKQLLGRGLIKPGGKLCIIGSIWQNIARQDKLSYCMSKAALQGLVNSACADLAKDGILINAVLPGALDTPMTRANVAAKQLDKLTGATLFGRLPMLQDVANLVGYLCSAENTGITGQFIAADLGFSHVRLL